ncbi:MAG: flagellar export chaperone FlgN [Armatimonadetes bacterium]|nr:flagellar export chaperone FlgN [Armatimonadota bacterium]
MTDAIAALAAEVDCTCSVCELLERQREALLERDLPRINALTRELETAFEALVAAVDARTRAFAATDVAGSEVRQLARRAREAQARLSVLVALNQAIIGDRLACISAALGVIHPVALNAGYEPAGGRADAAARGVLTRTA